MRTASEHHALSASLSAVRYASTTSGTMYSRSSRSNASIEKPGSSAFMLRITRAVSFSSNHDATVDVTERSESTTGFSDSWYAPCSSANLRRIGLVSLSCCQRSWRGDEACKTSASPALRVGRG